MFEYKKRVADLILKEKIEGKGAVLIEGPKWCGKTTTAEQLAKFRRISDENRAGRRKQSVTLRLSPRAIKKARSLGKGYTSVLSRILESALEDNELIQRYL